MEKSCIWNFNPVKNENKLPKSWEEFCENYPIKEEECYINSISCILARGRGERIDADFNCLPNRATAEEVLALCQLIQLRNCYNGDWVPYWKNESQIKFIITFEKNAISSQITAHSFPEILYFKTKELRDEFLRCFRPLIEKLKPLYGIMEGGEE